MEARVAEALRTARVLLAAVCVAACTSPLTGTGDTIPSVLTAVHVAVDDFDASGGDASADVTMTSQVFFDLSQFGLGAAVAADSVSSGLFSCTRIVTPGSIEASGLTFSATVTDDAGMVCGPVIPSNSASMDNVP